MRPNLFPKEYGCSTYIGKQKCRLVFVRSSLTLSINSSTSSGAIPRPLSSFHDIPRTPRWKFVICHLPRS